MKTYLIEFLIFTLLLLVQPLEILLMPKRYGVQHAKSFPWVLLTSFFSLSALFLLPIEQNTDTAVLLTGFIVAGIIILIASKMFSGHSYKIADVEGHDLKLTLQKAIESTGMKISEIEVVEESRKNVYKIAESKNRINIEIREQSLSKDTYYILEFNRWIDRKSRHDVLDYISDRMSRFDLPIKKKSVKVIETTLFVAALIVLFVSFNFKWLHETEYPMLDEASLPVELNVTAFDRRTVDAPSDVQSDAQIVISDRARINQFFEGFSGANQYRNNEDDAVTLVENAYYQVEYGHPSQSIYVMADRCYLYIPFDAIRETSTFKRVMVDFYRLYGKKEGVLYNLSYDFSDLETIRVMMKKLFIDQS